MVGSYTHYLIEGICIPLGVGVLVLNPGNCNGTGDWIGNRVGDKLMRDCNHCTLQSLKVVCLRSSLVAVGKGEACQMMEDIYNPINIWYKQITLIIIEFKMTT